MSLIPEPDPIDVQICTRGRQEWSVARLVFLARDLPVLDIPMAHLCLDEWYAEMDMRTLCKHVLTIQRASLEFPIILDANGSIMDGRRRVMKALINKAETIRAKRFLETPAPCRIRDA